MIEPRDDDKQLQGMRQRPGDGSQARRRVGAYEAPTERLEPNLQVKDAVVKNLPASARLSLESANVVILEQELETFRDRLDYWRQPLQVTDLRSPAERPTKVATGLGPVRGLLDFARS